MALLQEVGSSLSGNIGLGRQVGRLFFPREYSIGDIEIDSILSEAHSSTAQVTSYPVESGGSMADHIVVDPSTVIIRGVVSDISSNEFIDYGMIGLSKEISDDAKGKESKTRSQLVWAQLRDAQSKRELISIQTGLRLYENMAIVALQVDQDKDTSLSLHFTATLKEVLSIDFDVRSDAVTLITDSPETEVAKGNQPTADRMKTVAKKGTAKPNNSLAYDAYEKIKGAL